MYVGVPSGRAITRSSSDRVNANIQPAISAGAIIGKVITKNTFNGVAPKSIAASSIERSNSRRRELITTET
ncbi:hypothetical protein D3C87_2027350 [compost metagenome]